MSCLWETVAARSASAGTSSHVQKLVINAKLILQILSGQV